MGGLEAPQSHNWDRPRCRVLIVGCGLGGLAAAITIQESGHEVTVLERMTELREIGAGIQVPPNATIILKKWGILEDVRAHAMQAETANMLSYKDGKLLSSLNMSTAIEECYMAPYLLIHRADLQQILLHKAQSLGVVVSLNSEVSRIDFSKPQVELVNGKYYEADVILGADGERSACREALLGRVDPLQDSGDQIIRITVKMSDVLKHKDLVHLVEPPNINFWVGPDAGTLTYSLKRDGLFNIVLMRAHEADDQVIYGAQKIGMDEVRIAFEQWDSKFQTLLNIAQDCSQWTLLQSNDITHWTHPESKFTLVGDAAHAMLPFLAQGAAMVFEDAAVLGVLFAAIEHKSQLPDVLSIYERVRKPRAMEMRRRSRAVREIYAMKDGPLQEERDRQLLKHAPFDGYPNYLADPVLQKWMFGYRAIEEAEKAWQSYKRGEWPGTSGLWNFAKLA